MPHWPSNPVGRPLHHRPDRFPGPFGVECEAGSHMGERRSDGANASFRWDSKAPPVSPSLVVALPCAQTPLCARGSATTSLDDTGGSLESQRKLAFAPSDRLSPKCEPSSHSPPKGPGNRSERWRSGHLAGFEGQRGMIGPIGRGVYWAPCPLDRAWLWGATRRLPSGSPGRRLIRATC